MYKLNRIKFLSYSAEDLFNLVMDIDSYQEFLPWCKSARIISKNDEYIIADLTISAKGFTEKYHSKITTNITNDLLEINVEAISGPFKFLKNNWKFYRKHPGCIIEFYICFEFSNIIFNKLMGLFFKNITDKMIESFEERAKTVLIPNL